MTRLIVQGSGNYAPPPDIQGTLILCSGASNTWGPNAGLAGNTTGVLYWDSDVSPGGGAGVISTFWHASHGTSFHPSHGPDRSMIAELLAAPGNIYSGVTAVLNVACGSSFFPDWQIGQSRYNSVKAATQLAISLLPSAFPQVTSWACRQVRNQGSSDMRVNSLPYQQGWAAGQASWTSALQTDIVAPAFAGFPHSWKPDLLVQQNPLLTGAFFVAQGVIPQQYIYVGESPGSAPHVVEIAGVGYYEPDEVHYTQLGNIDGGALIGQRIVFLDANGM